MAMRLTTRNRLRDRASPREMPIERFCTGIPVWMDTLCATATLAFVLGIWRPLCSHTRLAPKRQPSAPNCARRA
jgi:hypothetical protein